MSIERHGKLFRVREMVNGTRYTVTFDHKPTNAEIRLALSKEITRLPVSASKRTFRQCAEDFIRINDGVKSPNTLKEYRAKLRRLPESLTERPVCDFTEQIVQSYISSYSREVNPRTGRKRAYKTVKDMAAFICLILHKYGHMRFEVSLPQSSEAPASYMPSEEDIQRILKHIKGTDLEVPFMISAFSSLRRSEVCALTLDDVKDCMIHVNKTKYWDDIDKEWKIRDNTKTEASQRYTPIPQKLQDLIYEKGCIYRHSPHRLLKDLNDAQDALGIPRFKFHALRAYYASAAHAMGIPDEYIMANGGWKNDFVLKKVYRKPLSDKQITMNSKISGHFSAMI